MGEPLPVAEIQKAVLEFLEGRDDAAIFGAQAVNAYVSEPRMTQDVDVMSPHAGQLADELCVYLRDRFRIVVRTRQVKEGLGFHVYQLHKEGDRHLVDLRQVSVLPPTRQMGRLLVVEPAELLAEKMISYHARLGKPKSGTDWRDVAMLLLTFPDLKARTGPVRDRLDAAGAGAGVLAAWETVVAQTILPEDDDDI